MICLVEKSCVESLRSLKLQLEAALSDFFALQLKSVLRYLISFD